jgi:hypothetical protein
MNKGITLYYQNRLLSEAVSSPGSFSSSLFLLLQAPYLYLTLYLHRFFSVVVFKCKAGSGTKRIFLKLNLNVKH